MGEAARRLSATEAVAVTVAFPARVFEEAGLSTRGVQVIADALVERASRGGLRHGLGRTRVGPFEIRFRYEAPRALLHVVRVGHGARPGR